MLTDSDNVQRQPMRSWWSRCLCCSRHRTLLANDRGHGQACGCASNLGPTLANAHSIQMERHFGHSSLCHQQLCRSVGRWNGEREIFLFFRDLALPFSHSLLSFVHRRQRRNSKGKKITHPIKLVVKCVEQLVNGSENIL